MRKKRGIEYYEVGETPFRQSMFLPMNRKEKSIAYFKRGFGDQTLPLKRWVWFADPAEELRFLEERLENYKRHIASETEAREKEHANR